MVDKTGLSTAAQRAVSAPVTNAPLSTTAGQGFRADPTLQQPALKQLVLPMGDRPQYSFSLTVSKYKRASWRQMAQSQAFAQIVLPLPNSLVDEAGVKYDAKPIGAAGAAGAAMGGLDFSSGEAFGGSFLPAMKNVGSAAVAGGSQALINGAVKGLEDEAKKTIFSGMASGAYKGLQSAAGYATNDFMTVLLQGPEYKQRDFIWKIVPESAKEAETLRDIGKLLKDAQAPSLALAEAFFRYPAVFQPKILSDGKDTENWTLSYKKSVLVRSSINYTPTGTFVPRRDGSPYGVEIRLSFLELELWLAGDYGSIIADQLKA